MRAVIRLEMIADDFYWRERRNLLSFDEWLRYMRKLGHDKSPSWVAHLTLDRDNPRRKFLRGVRDYSQANRCGSRGIFCYYPLKDGIYEINDRYKFNKVRHYFIHVEGESIDEITARDAIRYLRDESIQDAAIRPGCTMPDSDQS